MLHPQGRLRVGRCGVEKEEVALQRQKKKKRWCVREQEREEGRGEGKEGEMIERKKREGDGRKGLPLSTGTARVSTPSRQGQWLQKACGALEKVAPWLSKIRVSIPLDLQDEGPPPLL